MFALKSLSHQIDKQATFDAVLQLGRFPVVM